MPLLDLPLSCAREVRTCLPAPAFACAIPAIKIEASRRSSLSPPSHILAPPTISGQFPTIVCTQGSQQGLDTSIWVGINGMSPEDQLHCRRGHGRRKLSRPSLPSFSLFFLLHVLVFWSYLDHAHPLVTQVCREIIGAPRTPLRHRRAPKLHIRTWTTPTKPVPSSPRDIF